MLDRETAEQVADMILEERSRNRWHLPGTRDKIIEAAMNNDKWAAVHAISDILDANEIDDPFGDPCDECKADRWFYYHPALVL